MTREYVITEAQVCEIEALGRHLVDLAAILRRVDVGEAKSRLTPTGETFGERVKSCRKARKLKQFQLAFRAGMSAAQLCQIERGNVVPSITMAERLADALGVPVVKIMGGAKSRRSEP